MRIRLALVFITHIERVGMDDHIYLEYQTRKFIEYENLCRRCGACCGIKDGDPCENLSLAPEGSYYCSIYENRFGIRRTIAGREISCVPIRRIIHKTWMGRAECGYVRSFSSKF